MAKIQPDQMALEIAYRSMRTTLALKEVQANPALRAVLESRARAHMRRRARADLKKLQANDSD